VNVPKARFAYLFPNSRSALVQVRLRPGLGEAQRDRTIDLVRAATALPEFKLTNGGGKYIVTGAPVVLSALTAEVSDAVTVLLVAALIVMALTLLFVFRSPSRRLVRLLPLAVAMAAACPRSAPRPAPPRWAGRRSPPPAWPRPRASWCSCSRRCRWSGGSASCWSSASACPSPAR
jgi:hypothetical protein